MSAPFETDIIGPSSRWSRSRLALGLSPTPIPGLVLIAGLVIGPHGIHLLSESMLSFLDPAVSARLPPSVY